ncbi:MAG TPA: hypothetical protein VF828_01995 [Patescibacteria group bacterium]
MNNAKSVSSSPKKDIQVDITEPQLNIDTELFKRFRLIVVAYSDVERDQFPTEEAYEAEAEVISRAQRVADYIRDMAIEVKCYPADEYFLTNILVDKPDLVINLVDTLKGKDRLQTSVPAALDMLDIPYTGAGMQGLMIGNNRYITKQLMTAQKIPTPPFQYISKTSIKIKESIGLPLIVKLNESGGSVGIDNNAVQETFDDANKRVKEMIDTYHIPVIVEKFIDGSEVTATVFDDGLKKHIFLAKKIFNFIPDGKHAFTSLESYHVKDSYTYEKVDKKLASKIEPDVLKAFTILRLRDYGKFDIRVDGKSGKVYITDSNPNTAFGPSIGLPFTEIADLYGLTFIEILKSMLTKYASKLSASAPPT